MDTIRLSLFSLLISSAFLAQADTDFDGKGSIEISTFPDTASLSQQSSNYSSAALEADIYHSFDNDDSFSLKLFSRFADADTNRNHSDIREAVYLTTGETWELRAGINKVYWGVTEANHLVDIINQTDAVESLDGEEKLGQLMINYTYLSDNGNIDFFILPGFRERTFTSRQGRPAFALPIKTENSTYESSDKQNHIDYALRWSHFVGDLEFALSQFEGTSREAELIPGNFIGSTPTTLTPHYSQISQTGLEVQYNSEDYIWKAEVINRKAKKAKYTFTAATLGFESTLVGIMDSESDLGLIAEMMLDSRTADVINPFQKDLFLGGRLTLNDAQSTEGISGFIIDLDSNAVIFSLEANRRLGDNFKLSIESRFYSNVDSDPFLKNIKQDSYLKANLDYFF